MKKILFEGVATAIITPFSGEKIDFSSFKTLIHKQLNAKIDAIVVLGTTGEPCTISNEERLQIIKCAVNECKNKCKVIVGCGSNCTKTAIQNIIAAETLGADGALVVTPYYNKCTQNGLYEYYKAISDSTNLPIIAYNVPSRTGVNILPATLNKIADLKNIYGIKEASGNISQILEMFNLVGDKIGIYSGEDNLNTIFYMLGGNGCISVTSNIVPNLVKKIFSLCKTKNYNKANTTQFDLFNLTNLLFCEINPIPIKAALNHLGLCKNQLRAPLTPIEEKNFDKLKNEINLLWNKYDCM